MKTVCNLNMCTGCKACIGVCSKSAIILSESMRHINAIIDETKCNSCGACAKICQQVTPLEKRNPISWFQGWAIDSQSREKSSSGGFAYQLMKTFMDEGGKVCSCVFLNGEFKYEVAESVGELEKFRGSKYVKSTPEDIYKRVRELIRHGHKVLFLGLPCHVAGIRKFVGDNNKENLYTVDLICHGTPSMKILSGFLEEKGFDIYNLDSITFRQKNKFGISVKDAGMRKNNTIVPSKVRDRYTIGFLNGLFYTDNCYKCQYAELERISDITIGDSWGSDLEGSVEGERGISLALCQTKRGEALLKRCQLKLMSVDLKKAVDANHQLYEPARISDERNQFFSLVESGETINKAIAKCYPQICRRQDIKTILSKLHFI